MNMILNKFRNSIKENKGFVLVDSMVAVLILAIGLAALAFLYTHGTQILHNSNTQQKAIQVAAERLELLKVVNSTATATESKDKTRSQINTIINTANNNSTVSYEGETYTATIKPTILTDSDSLQALSTTTSVKRNGEEFIYPVSVEVTWNANDATGTKITLSTYVTVASNE